MDSVKCKMSIGLPVYNGERFLPETLDSLLAQTFAEFELLISDNASTDRTEEICRSYSAQDARIRYFRNESNVGVYKNFNQVFLRSSGEYFKWASADDVCGRELLAQCLQILESNSTAVLAYPKTRFIDEAGQPLAIVDQSWNLQSDLAQARFRYVIYAGHWTNVVFGVIRTKVLAKTRLFPIYNSGDYRLLGELSLAGKFIETTDCLLSRRIHQQASSQNTAPEWQTKFYTGKSGRPGLPFWHLCVDHYATILRSQLPLGHKLSLGRAVAHRMFLAKRKLLHELATAGEFYFTKLR
jgi:GT2 family glycosyltransferase